MDVAGEIAFRIIAAKGICFQGRFDCLDFSSGYFTTVQTGLGQHFVDAASVIKFALGFVNVEDTTFFHVELKPNFASKAQQMLTRLDCHFGGGDCMGFIVWDVAHELCHP